MSYQDTWIGLTVSVMVFMFCFEAVQIWAIQLGDNIGPENVTIDRTKIDYAFPRDVPIINGTNNADKDEGGWFTWLDSLLNTPNAEQSTSNNDVSGINFAKVIKNVFINGTYGFSAFMHNILGLPNDYKYIHTWFIGFIQWFLIIGNMLIVMQVISKFLPGG